MISNIVLLLLLQRCPAAGHGRRRKGRTGGFAGLPWRSLEQPVLLGCSAPTRDSEHTFPFPCCGQVEEPEASKSEPEDDEDEVEDLPNRRPHLQGMIYRKPSQTSVYLQEWDIPFEQIQLGDPIGQGRWGKVYKGKWHGEVAIRLLEIDGNNQDHLKLFKKEVMNYRQTRHENVVLFMGACMNPPHLAIITR